MCEICMHTPCLSGCPNEKVTSIPCSCCGKLINIGDYFAVDEENDGDYLCDKCADDKIDEYQRLIDNLYYRDTLTEDDIADY